MGRTNKITRLFIIIQVVLYLGFLHLDLIGGYYVVSSYIKYFIIILCLLYTFINYDRTRKCRSYCLILGLIFTIIADYYLLLLGYNFEYGIGAFIIVQQIYGSMLDYSSRPLFGNVLKRFLLQLSITFIIALLLYILDFKIELIVVLSIFYFISILMNTFRAIKVSIKYKDDRSNILFAIGMILFVLCDINVGLFNLSYYLDISVAMATAIIRVSSLMMWLFYAPSQILIALSSGSIGTMHKIP